MCLLFFFGPRFPVQARVQFSHRELLQGLKELEALQIEGSKRERGRDIS